MGVNGFVFNESFTLLSIGGGPSRGFGAVPTRGWRTRETLRKVGQKVRVHFHHRSRGFGLGPMTAFRDLNPQGDFLPSNLDEFGFQRALSSCQFATLGEEEISEVLDGIEPIQSGLCHLANPFGIS
jgi:hypothetical protein